MSRVLVSRKRYDSIASRENHAVGAESRKVGNRLDDFWRALQNVVSVQPRIMAVRSLTDIYRNCAVENWDAEGASPITERTYEEALKFLGALPLTVRVPDVVPEPSGAVGFEWRYAPNAVFVASVHGIQKISYAGLFGPGVTAHGTEDFIDAIPDTIMANLQRVREIR